MTKTQNNKMLVSIAFALIMMLGAFVIMEWGSDDSHAAEDVIGTIYECGKVEQLETAINEANVDEDIDKIIITADIELNTTLRITKPLILTTNCGATLKPASNFTPGQVLEDGKMVTKNCLIHVDGHNSSDIGRPGSIGKLKIGEEVTTDPNKIITLDGGNRYRVVYCEMRGSPAGPWQTLVLNAGIITNGCSDTGAGLHLTRAATFLMNGGSITGNHIDPTHPAFATDYKFSADVWIGSGVQKATIENGTVGKMFVRSWKEGAVTLPGQINVNGGSVDTVYLDHHYNSSSPAQCKGSVLTYSGGSIAHVLLGTSKNTYNNPTTFSHSEVYQSAQNPLLVGAYYGGAHIAKVGQYGYGTLEDAINAAGPGDVVTIIGDCNVSYPIHVTKDITIEVAEYRLNGVTETFAFKTKDRLSFSVTIDLNGGSAIIPSEWTDMGDGTYFRSYLYGTSFSDILADLDSVTPSKYSFDFGSWVYAVGGQVGIDGTRIQAMWDPVYYTVTFDANGGTIGQTNVTVRAGEAIGSIPETTYNGHTFMGWFTENGDKVTSETQVTSDMTIKADWKEVVIIDDPYQGAHGLPGTGGNNNSEEPDFTIPIAIVVAGILEILGIAGLNRFF